MEERRRPTEGDLVWLIDQGRNWVVRQHAKYHPIATPLSDPLKGLLSPFFDPATLNVARCCSVPVIENPSFRAEAIARGLVQPDAMNFTKMDGVTFQDTFLVSQAKQLSNAEVNALIFHELVHVAQYAALGVDEIVTRYARGLAGGRGDYYAIPLELVAYTLQVRFMTGSESEFSVEEFVQKTVGLRY